MRVLVVEDDADLRTMMWRIFADARHEVAVAADGAEAIEKLHALRPELVVLDLVLPGIDGWGVLRSVRRLPAPPPVVVVSAQTQEGVFTRAASEGVCAYVEKPFSMEELLETCERAAAEGARHPRERRIAPRRTLRAPAQVLAREQGWWTDGELLDLGSGGARVTMRDALPATGTVRLAFAVPGDGHRVSVDGRVQWQAPAGPGFAYGLAFLDVLPDAQRQIDALVEDPA